MICPNPTTSASAPVSFSYILPIAAVNFFQHFCTPLTNLRAFAHETVCSFFFFFFNPKLSQSLTHYTFLSSSYLSFNLKAFSGKPSLTFLVFIKCLISILCNTYYNLLQLLVYLSGYTRNPLRARTM